MKKIGIFREFVKAAKTSLAATRGNCARPRFVFAVPCLLAVFCVSFALAFFSCENSSSDSSAVLYALSKQNSSGQNAPPKPAVTVGKDGKKYITFSGSAGGEIGAVPASMAKGIVALDEETADNGGANISKSAKPGLDTTSASAACQWFARATSGSDVVDGVFGTTAATHRVFSMSLEVGKTWSVVCGIKAKDSEPPAVILSDAYSFEATEDNAVFSHTFTPVPQEGGSGSVSLQISVDSSVGRATAVCSADAWKAANGDAEELELPISSSIATLALSGLASGSYDVAINFYKNIGTAGSPSWLLLCASPQTITVFANASSDTWVSNGGIGKITGNKLVVDSAEIAQYAPTIIYVGDTSAVVSDAKPKSDSNNGSASEPLETLAAAAKMIDSTGASSAKKDYTIFVCGTVLGDAELASGLDAKARSIAIQNLEGADAAVLEGSGSGSVLKVATSAPVTLKNITITKGNAEKGGGIYMGAGSSVTLDQGCVVTQNKSSGNGAGICVEGTESKKAKLAIKNGAVISKNSFTANNKRGMGVYASYAQVTMSGAQTEISQNKDSSHPDARGAVALRHSAFTLNGGKITKNETLAFAANFFVSDSSVLEIKGGEISFGKVESSSYDANAAGIWAEGSSEITMTGGKICNNRAEAKGSGKNANGAGLWLDSNVTFKMSGGEISQNCAASASGKVTGGAVKVLDGTTFEISGSARIPYGVTSGSTTEKGAGKNDVWLQNEIDSSSNLKRGYVTVTGSLLASDEKVAAITPQAWGRGVQVLKASGSLASVDSVVGRFETSSEGFSVKKSKTIANSGVLFAEIFVAKNGVDEGNDEGTKNAPFKTLAYAVSTLDGGEPQTIWINGTLTEKQKIPSKLSDGTTAFDTSRCSELTIKGFGGSGATINAGGSGSALTIRDSFPSGSSLANPVPIVIENLKITGGSGEGYSETKYGGGIFLTDGDLTLSDGVVVTGNTATYGGGVRLYRPACRLFMKGTAVIGVNGDISAAATESTAGANKGSHGAGISNNGSVFLGYERNSDGSPKEAPLTGGVIGNYAEGGAAQGAGICNDGSSSVLKISSGNVSYNGVKITATISSSEYGGGGVYNKATFEMSGGEISGNESSGTYAYGGGVYNKKTFEMTGGKLEGNVANSQGGAVYLGGSNAVFSMGGTAYIPYGDEEKNNDVYLNGKTVTVDSGLSLPSGVDSDKKNAALVVSGWKRGTKFLTSESDITSSLVSRFLLTKDDDGWNKEIASDKKSVSINSPIYVADSSNPPSGFGKGKTKAAGATGTKTSPYSSIAEALSDTNVFDSTSTAQKITIAGTVTGAQSISGQVKASALTITGYDSSSQLKRYATEPDDAQTDGTTLTVEATVGTSTTDYLPVTITNLAITGGKKNGSGGGIYLSKGILTLTDGAKVCGNQATSCGGGIHVEINGTLFMNGTSVVGDTSDFTADSSTLNLSPTSTSIGCANKAAKGGGIYSAGKVYIGCDESGVAAEGFELKPNYGVRRNYATSYGGGVHTYYSAGIFKAASGQISFNGAGYYGGGLYVGGAAVNVGAVSIKSNKSQQGGGLYVANGFSATMDGAASIAKNSATTYGGGVYTHGTFTMSAGTIGGDSSDLANTAPSGGAVYVHADTSKMGIFNMSGGSISYNSATDYGGAVNVSKASSGTNAGTFSMSGGTVSNNSASAGGAVYNNGAFKISGGASIPYGVPGSGGTTVTGPGKNDVYLSAEKTVTIATTNLTATGTVATITPNQFKRGRKILSAGVTVNETQLNALKAKFALSSDNDGWDKVNIEESSALTGVKISSPIYVVSSSGTAPSGFSNGKTSGANGTKTSPYATISAAAQASDLAEASGKITVVGTLTGTQSISSVTNGVSAVTLAGYDTNATINGNAGGSALTIGLVKTFTIKDLAITNGKADAGGGINITAAATVNLESGAKVYSNKAIPGGTGGAGVYVASGATLYIKSGSEIYSNLADTSGSKNIMGAGVYNVGKVVMTGGQIYKNKAYDGGGVYNTGDFYVQGTALIGDDTESAATGSTVGSDCSNSATHYGGGIYNKGKVYFGCNSSGAVSTGSGASLVSFALATGYGARRNYAAENGGGIYHEDGVLKMANGSLSYNRSDKVGGALYIPSSKTVDIVGALTMNNNATATDGGAVYNLGTLNITGAADISGNSVVSDSADVCGGAIYNHTSGTLTISGAITMNGNSASTTGSGKGAYGGAISSGGTINMSAGTIGSSSSPNTVSCGTSIGAKKWGGAISLGGTFNISGSAKVYPGTEASNDVYLPYPNSITVNDDYTGSGNNADSKMTIYPGPGQWRRGHKVLTGSSVTATNCGYFKILDSDNEWSILTETDYLGTLDAQIWVAGTSPASGVGSTKSASDSNHGNKKQPYMSIKKAAEQCWSADRDFTIHVTGKIVGADQIIPEADTTNKYAFAKSITLEGETGNDNDIINRSLTSAPTSSTVTGTALKINNAAHVIIKKIKITGGYAKSYGGGIYVSKAQAKLTLSTGALVTANKSAGGGGGIYFAGTADSGGINNMGNLIMEDTAIISANQALGSSTGKGGGVYIQYANLFMKGSTVIGESGHGETAASSKDACSNYATINGGGVYAGTNGDVWLGYSAVSSVSPLSGGVYYNYSSSGGGIADTRNLYIYQGSVSNNGASSGGGVYLSGSVNRTVTLGGGKISYNSASSNGGGLYSSINDSYKALVKMNGTSSNETRVLGNTATTNGGGFFVGSNTSLCMSGYSVIGSTTASGPANAASGAHSNSATFGGGIYVDTKATAWFGYSDAATNKTATLQATYGIRHNYAGNGGGVHNNGTVYFNSGRIAFNGAESYGGGVYVANNGVFCMSGSAVVGELKTSDTSYATSTACSNKAGSNGGGIYTAGDPSNGGSVYVGYTAPPSGSNKNYDNSFTGGVGYNYATTHGGGLCINTNVGASNFAGGKISNNTAGTNGGAIRMDGNVYFGGDVFIPSTAKTKNDVWQFSKNSTFNVLTDRILTQGTVATITPNSYATDNQVMTATSAASSANYFMVTPQSGSADNWGISKTTGKLTTIIGTKSGPSAVGDIVFTDGSARPYVSGMSLTTAQQNGAIAVTVYSGTDCNNSGETGRRTLAVGLVTGTKDSGGSHETKRAWCIESAKAHSGAINTIAVSYSGSDGNFTFSGVKNGKDNLSKIATYLGSNNDTGTATKYPAFYYAKNYSSQTGSNVSGTSYATGWYLPSLAELYYFYKNYATANAAAVLLGKSFANDGYWSSSTKSGDATGAYYFQFEQNAPFGPGGNTSRKVERCVCAYHEF